MMTINLDNPADIAIHSYVPGTVTLKAQGDRTGASRLIDCQSSLIITQQEVLEGWPPGCIDELEQHHFEEVWRRKPELALLGSGENFRFPAARLMVEFAEMGIGLEVMDTAAACRTYNILSAEGRDVMALLLIS